MMSSSLLPVQVITGVELAKNRLKNSSKLAYPKFPRYTQHVLVIAIAAIMAGCSSTPVQPNNQKVHGKKTHTSNAIITSGQNDLDLESADSLEELLQATDMEAVEGDRLAVLRYGNLWKRILVGYRMDLSVNNSRIDAQRNWFISRQPYIDRLSARASRYIYYTVTEAERRGIPTELALLPVIESSYDPFANSGASAAGMWQFIPSTGREYGLRQNQYYDGRRDVVESTRAAYDFLTNLYKQFGSWELALAAYNAGGGRIQQAINRNIAQGLPTDYWSLRLPTETMNYVPRFLAVAQMIKDPQNYGVKLPNIANRSHFRQVSLSGPVDLDQVVRTTGLSSKEVLELNPAFLQGVTAPTGPHRVLIPTSLPMTVDSRLKAIPLLDPSRFGFSSEGALLAMSQPITQTITQTVTRTTTPAMLSTAQVASMMSSGTRTNNSGNVTQSIATRNNQRIPTDSDSLAAMANQAVVPSSARIAKVVENIQSRPVVSTQKTTTTTTSTSVLQPVITKTDATTITVTTRPTIPNNSNFTFTPITPANTTNAKTINPATSINTPTITSSITTTTENTLVSSPSAVTQSPIVVAPAQSPNITPIIAMTIDKKTSDQNRASIVDPLDGKVVLSTLQPQQTVVETKTEIKVSNIDVRKLTSSDLKINKLIPAETKVIAQVKTPEKPKGVRTVYTVKAGDTLINVATRAGLSWRDIAKWNQMDANANLITGTPLYLYGAKKVVEAPATSYVVQSGDTLTD
ncbi:MAG: transglycosylase SLT domain-containing protein, partial [Candidatus Saccharibacteria bacterium]|nr:transglycosylase SLT domain-containing protein [Moraxellaceae bacterium]